MSNPKFDQQGQNVNEQYVAGRDVNIDARREDNPYPEQEEYESAGGMARGLIILGGILMTGGFLTVIGSAVMGFIGFSNAASSMISGDVPSFSSFLSTFTIIPIGIGIVFVGMVVFTIGRMMGRSSAYKKRMRDQRNRYTD